MKPAAFLPLVAIVLSVVACAYDDDERCGPNQRLISNDRCVCSSGLVLSEDGCVSCGENEVEANGKCECVEGYGRSSEAAECAPNPSGLGDSCDLEAEPCASPRFPECLAVEGSSGYCTSTGCASSDDCSGGYRCQLGPGGSFCRRPATGQGQGCESDADCVGQDAGFCELLQANVCVVACTAGGSECFDNEDCCDLSVIGGGVICVPDGKCPIQDGG